MSDIALELVNNCFDIVIENDDLKPDNGLETAVSISLFSDRRVSDDDLPDLETSKRGWWGDAFPEQDQDLIGSRLWLNERAKVSTETLRRSEEFCQEALKWLQEDGIVDEIKIESTYNDSNNMIINIEITRPDEETERFSVLWDEQELRRL